MQMNVMLILYVMTQGKCHADYVLDVKHNVVHVMNRLLMS